MGEDIDALRAELADVRAEVAALRSATPTPSRAMSRRHLLTGLAGLGAAGAAATVAGASPAAAADGDNLVLGQENTATETTRLTVTREGDGVTDVTIGDSWWGLTSTAKAVGLLGHVTFGGVSGVWGETDSVVGAGVTGHAATPGAFGVIANSAAGPAIAAQSDADGVTLLLMPATRTGPPTSLPEGLTRYEAGSISLDDQGDLWVCLTEGDPGTWTRLLREDTTGGRTVPITPFRALDTRAPGGRPNGAPTVPGQVKGPLRSGQPVTLDLAGITPIPASASGVVGNLTVVAPSSGGYLIARPSGTATSTSSLNFTAGAVVGNAFTSGLGPDGLTIVAVGPSTYHLVVDVTAYIT